MNEWKRELNVLKRQYRNPSRRTGWNLLLVLLAIAALGGVFMLLLILQF